MQESIRSKDAVTSVFNLLGVEQVIKATGHKEFADGDVFKTEGADVAVDGPVVVLDTDAKPLSIAKAAGRERFQKRGNGVIPWRNGLAFNKLSFHAFFLLLRNEPRWLMRNGRTAMRYALKYVAKDRGQS